jgi:hypothetical protein
MISPFRFGRLSRSKRAGSRNSRGKSAGDYRIAPKRAFQETAVADQQAEATRARPQNNSTVGLKRERLSSVPTKTIAILGSASLPFITPEPQLAEPPIDNSTTI